MPNTVGSSSSLDTILSDVATYIAANSGWVLTASGTEGTGVYRILSLAGKVISMKSAELDRSVNTDATVNTGIGIYGGTAYASGGALWRDKVTGGPVPSTLSGYTHIADHSWACATFGNLTLGSTINWFCYVNADEIWIVLRLGDYYQHISFGVMETYGTGWNGGFYFGASLAGQFMDLDPDSVGNYNSGAMGLHVNNATSHTAPPSHFFQTDLTPEGWTGFVNCTTNNANEKNQRLVSYGGFNPLSVRALMQDTPNMSTLDAYLIPLNYEWYDSITENNFITVGSMVSTFIINMWALNAEAEVAVGGKTYKIFPLIRRTTWGTKSSRQTINTTNRQDPYASSAGGAIHYLWGYAIEVTA